MCSVGATPRRHVQCALQSSLGMGRAAPRTRAHTRTRRKHAERHAMTAAASPMLGERALLPAVPCCRGLGCECCGAYSWATYCVPDCSFPQRTSNLAQSAIKGGIASKRNAALLGARPHTCGRAERAQGCQGAVMQAQHIGFLGSSQGYASIDCWYRRALCIPIDAKGPPVGHCMMAASPETSSHAATSQGPVRPVVAPAHVEPDGPHTTRGCVLFLPIPPFSGPPHIRARTPAVAARPRQCTSVQNLNSKANRKPADNHGQASAISREGGIGFKHQQQHIPARAKPSHARGA